MCADDPEARIWDAVLPKTRPQQHLVSRQQILDGTVYLNSALVQDHEMVTDPFQVADQMGRENQVRPSAAAASISSCRN